MDMSARLAATFDLVSLPLGRCAVSAGVDWSRLAEPEAKRLREFGFDDGVSVEVLHRARWGGGPIACRIGRMTVAVRRTVAAAVRVA